MLIILLSCPTFFHRLIGLSKSSVCSLFSFQHITIAPTFIYLRCVPFSRSSFFAVEVAKIFEDRVRSTISPICYAFLLGFCVDLWKFDVRIGNCSTKGCLEFCKRKFGFVLREFFAFGVCGWLEMIWLELIEAGDDWWNKLFRKCVSLKIVFGGLRGVG